MFDPYSYAGHIQNNQLHRRGECCLLSPTESSGRFGKDQDMFDNTIDKAEWRNRPWGQL